MEYILNNDIIPIAKSTNVNSLQENIDTMKYLKNNYSELDYLNLYSPINNDTSNSIIANGQLRI